MLFRLSLRARLLWPTLSILALGLGVLVVVVLNTLDEGLQAEARVENAMISTRYAAEISSELDQSIEVARSLARSFKSLRSQGIQSRDVYNRLLKDELKDHPDILSTWTVWAPNALDGRDRDFANKAGNDATGRFVPTWTRDASGQPVEHPALDYEKPGDGDYYLVPQKTGQELFQDPYKYSYTGKPEDAILLSTFAIPLLVDGKFLGVVGVDVSLAKLNKLMNSIHVLKTGYAVLMTNAGVRVTHPRADMVGKKVGDDTPADKDALLAAIRDGNPYTLTKFNLRDGTKSLLTYEPVGKGIWNNPWSIVAITPLGEILSVRDKLAFLTIFLGVLMFVATGAAISFLVRQVTLPVRKVARVLKTIADGEGDLTQRLDLKRSDEIGDLARSYDAFVDRLSLMIQLMQSTAMSLKDSGGDLAAALTESAASLHQITSNIQSAKTHVVKQEQIASQTAVAVETISTHVDTLQDLTSRQGRAVETSGSAVEEMVGNIESVTRNVGSLGQSLKRLVDAAETGRNQFALFRERVTAVDNQSASLQETNEVIASIASQTNLLAMNAAIEAAHAGEAGRGFAVVSDEIRKLAEQASIQSKSTAEELKSLQSTIRDLVGDSETTEGAFTRILEDIDHVEALGSEVQSAMNEQQIGSRQILDGINDIREASHEVSDHAQAMGSEAKQTLETMSTLHQVTMEIRQGMDEIAEGTSDINQAVASISVQGESNKENVEKLASEASAFHVRQEA